MDPILYWNDVALEANRQSHTDGKDTGTLGPVLSARALAIVHLAMYDAYAGAKGNPAGLPFYLPGLPPAPPGAVAAAAATGAAHTALSQLFPSQRPFFDARLVGSGMASASVNASVDYGRDVATQLLTDRASDPDASSSGYQPSGARGRHRRDPDNPGQGFYAASYGRQSNGFAITQRWELKPPPPASTAPGSDYVKALQQVRAKGIAPALAGTLPAVPGRTPEQTLIGLFWGYDGAAELGTPPRLYNQIVRVVAEAQGSNADSNARLFALVNAAMADAGILAWDQKYKHDFWRPVVGIREHGDSLGPSAVGAPFSADADPGWLPLGAPKSNSLKPDKSPVKNFTPDFPAYPSGHATFGAAALHMTRLFYSTPVTVPQPHDDDHLFDGLTFVSEELNGVTRDNLGTVRPQHARAFPGGLWEMITENGLSRVYLGVHWSFDAFELNNMGKIILHLTGTDIDTTLNLGGVPLGLKIAEDIFADGMNPGKVGPRP